MNTVLIYELMFLSFMGESEGRNQTNETKLQIYKPKFILYI